MNLSEYLSQRGRASWLARKIGVHMPDVSNWKRESRPVPVRHCVAIERATKGQVTRKDLRPDDWHIIWPELKRRK